MGRAQRLGTTTYVGALGATLAAAVASPLGIGSLPSVAGIAVVAFGYSPLVWMGLRFADGAFAEPAAPVLAIARDPRWWVVAALVLIGFVGALGRTLTFARPVGRRLRPCDRYGPPATLLLHHGRSRHVSAARHRDSCARHGRSDLVSRLGLAGSHSVPNQSRPRRSVRFRNGKR